MFKLVNKARKNEKGFTLVELMVVVVIIGILVAIAVPLYNNVTASAAEKAHLANVRTIEGAIQTYLAVVDVPGGGAAPAQGTLEGSYVKTWPTAPPGWSGTYAVSGSYPNYTVGGVTKD